MKARWLPLVLVFAVPAWAVACAETPPPEVAPQPAATADATAAPTADPAPTAAPTAAPAADPPAAQAPPPKPGKERIVGKWQFSFEGEPKANAEAEAKKKFPKDKDQAKRDAHLKKIADEAAGEWIEFEGGYYISHTTPKGKDKVVAKIKYEVAKDDANALTMKPTGKDEVSKKELKDEVSITFTDDNTIHMVDPRKKITLVFKRK